MKWFHNTKSVCYLFIFLNNAATVAVNTTVPVIMNISNNNKNLGRFIHIHLYTHIMHAHTHARICKYVVIGLFCVAPLHTD